MTGPIMVRRPRHLFAEPLYVAERGEMRTHWWVLEGREAPADPYTERVWASIVESLEEMGFVIVTDPASIELVGCQRIVVDGQ